VLQGHLRATGDVDLIVDLDPDEVSPTQPPTGEVKPAA